jgi:hypothetical protein
LARRAEGIDYDGLPRSLQTKAIEPGDKGYAKVRSTYVRTGAPGLVLRPESVDEVIASLAFAREQDVPLAIRSGGHGISGRSTNDGGIVIDVGGLDRIEVLDAGAGRIRLGPGARWDYGGQSRPLISNGLAEHLTVELSELLADGLRSQNFPIPPGNARALPARGGPSAVSDGAVTVTVGG